MVQTRKKFEGFVRGLSDYIGEKCPDYTFFIYGSLANGAGDPSDMDGGIISPTIVTDKDRVLGISRRMSDLATQLDVDPGKVQINLVDAVSGTDGRLLSYSIDYTNFIRQHGLVLNGSGEQLRSLNGLDNRFGVLESSAFNFRSIRNKFLEWGYCERQGNEQTATQLLKICGLLRFLPRKIESLVILSKEKGKKSWVKSLSEMLSRDTKLDSLENLRNRTGQDLAIFDEFPIMNESEFEMIVRTLNLSEKTSLAGRALTTYEMVVGDYLGVCPPKAVTVETLV